VIVPELRAKEKVADCHKKTQSQGGWKEKVGQRLL